MTVWNMSETGAFIGAITGPVGLAVACITAWRTSVERIEVIPQVSDRTRDDRRATKFSIRVVNKSAFAVRIETASLDLIDDSGQPETVSIGDDLDPLPREVPARTAIVLSLDMRATIYLSMSTLQCAYVTTATGKRRNSSRFNKFRGMKLKDIQQTTAYAEHNA